MGNLLNKFKLQKLSITSYKKNTRSLGDKIKEMKVMFNPATYSKKYSIDYSCKKGINSSGMPADFSCSKSGKLELTFIFDGTNVSNSFSIINTTPKVSEQIKDFLELAYKVNGDIHQPNFLKIDWGDLKFDCRLECVDIQYKLIDRDGEPLRAELKTVFISYSSLEKKLKEAKLESPDITHQRVVIGGDTLPLMTENIYESSGNYIKVAQANKLNNFRALSAGQKINFPPIEK